MVGSAVYVQDNTAPFAVKWYPFGSGHGSTHAVPAGATVNSFGHDSENLAPII